MGSGILQGGRVRVGSASQTHLTAEPQKHALSPGNLACVRIYIRKPRSSQISKVADSCNPHSSFLFSPKEKCRKYRISHRPLGSAQLLSGVGATLRRIRCTLIKQETSHFFSSSVECRNPDS